MHFRSARHQTASLRIMVVALLGAAVGCENTPTVDFPGGEDGGSTFVPEVDAGKTPTSKPDAGSGAGGAGASDECKQKPAGTALNDQRDGDCARAVCDGKGGVTSEDDDSDVADDND